MELVMEGDARETVPFNYYPWAEVISATGRKQGVNPVYHVGDLVIVAFEGGDPNQPFILGSWATTRFGAPDLYSDLLGDDYSVCHRKWIYGDRYGEAMELSELDDERSARLMSGRAEYFAQGTADILWLSSDNSVTVSSEALTTIGRRAVLGANELFIEAWGSQISDYEADPPQDYAHIGLYSWWMLDMYASDEIHIGQYLDRTEELNNDDELERKVWHQSRLTAVYPRHLVLGTIARRYPDDGNGNPVSQTRDAYWSVPAVSRAWAQDTQTVDIEATIYAIRRADSGGEAGEEAWKVDQGFIGDYATWQSEYYARDRLWVGQYETETWAFQTDRAIFTGNRTVIGIADTADCIDGFLNAQGIDSTGHAGDGLGITGWLIETLVTEIWSKDLTQVRQPSSDGFDPVVPDYPPGAPAFEVNELNPPVMLVWSPQVIVQTPDFDRVGGGSRSEEAGGWGTAYDTTQHGIFFAPGVLRILGLSATTSYRVDDRINELFFWCDGEPPNVDSDFTVDVLTTPGRAIIRSTRTLWSDGGQDPPNGAPLHAHPAPDPDPKWFDVYRDDDGKIRGHHMGPDSATADQQDVLLKLTLLSAGYPTTKGSLLSWTNAGGLLFDARGHFVENFDPPADTSIRVPQLLSDLGDVSQILPNNGDVLTWNAGNALWGPAAPSATNDIKTKTSVNDTTSSYLLGAVSPKLADSDDGKITWDIKNAAADEQARPTHGAWGPIASPPVQQDLVSNVTFAGTTLTVALVTAHVDATNHVEFEELTEYEYEIPVVGGEDLTILKIVTKYYHYKGSNDLTGANRITLDDTVDWRDYDFEGWLRGTETVWGSPPNILKDVETGGGTYPAPRIIVGAWDAPGATDGMILETEGAALGIQVWVDGTDSGKLKLSIENKLNLSAEGFISVCAIARHKPSSTETDYTHVGNEHP
jgi:hypothetical protein